MMFRNFRLVKSRRCSKPTPLTVVRLIERLKFGQSLEVRSPASLILVASSLRSLRLVKPLRCTSPAPLILVPVSSSSLRLFKPLRYADLHPRFQSRRG